MQEYSVSSWASKSFCCEELTERQRARFPGQRLCEVRKGVLTCVGPADHAASTVSAASVPAQALRRWEAAMLVSPRSRASLRSVLRSGAISCGPVPARMR